MPLIKAFADQGEDLELIWLAGFVEDPEKGWQVRATTRGIDSDNVVTHLLPIGLLCALPLGKCYSGGDLTSLALHGNVVQFSIPNVADGEEVTAECIPPDLFPIKGRTRKVQRLLRYWVNGVEVLVPIIELIRSLFVHNKTMANALMHRSGLMELCRPELPGFHSDLHLHFTNKMPKKILNQTFVAEFAWTAVHPDARRSWDSVATLSKGQSYIAFYPPSLQNSTWTVRWMRKGNTALVLEILQLTGKRHPCDILRYSHPSMSETVSFRTRHLKEGQGDTDEPPPLREIRDYVVDDQATGSRIDTHQSALPVLTKLSTFDREIKITKVAESATRGITSAAKSEDSESGPGQGKISPDIVIRRRVRVAASIGEDVPGATLPPIEFRLLEPANPEYLGELEPLIGALHLMAEMLPTVRIAMSMCALKRGRAISVAGHQRRPCLISVFWPQARPPIVLLDVDHTGGFSLSSLALRYLKHLPFREMEEHIKNMLDGMVDNHGRWNIKTADAFADAVECIRLPRVLRHRERMDQKAYWKAWAVRLAERFGWECDLA
ncbi:hypothetical protein [Azospirillum sp. sgz302134]